MSSRRTTSSAGTASARSASASASCQSGGTNKSYTTINNLVNSKQDNKLLSTQIGDTINPQDEYYGKLYLQDNMLYYYDINFHNVLTDKIPIISIPKLEKLIAEYKKSKILSSNLKTKTIKNKSKKNTNKKRKTQKKKQ